MRSLSSSISRRCPSRLPPRTAIQLRLAAASPRTGRPSASAFEPASAASVAAIGPVCCRLRPSGPATGPSRRRAVWRRPSATRPPTAARRSRPGRALAGAAVVDDRLGRLGRQVLVVVVVDLRPSARSRRRPDTRLPPARTCRRAETVFAGPMLLLHASTSVVGAAQHAGRGAADLDSACLPTGCRLNIV